MTTTVLQEPTELHKAFEAFIKADYAKEIFPCRGTKYYSSDSIDILLYRAFTSGAHFKDAHIAALTKDAEPVAIVEGLINFDGRFALSYGAKVKVGDKLYTHPPALKLIDSADLAEIRKEYRLNGAITIDGTLKLIKGVQHAFCKKNGLSLEAQK